MEDARSLIHLRGQVTARVTTILKVVEQAEKDISKVSFPVLRVYSKKLDTLRSEFLALREEIHSINPSAEFDDSEFEILHTEAVIGVGCLFEMLLNPAEFPSVPSSSAYQQQSVVVPNAERCEIDHPPPVNQNRSESTESSPPSRSYPLQQFSFSQPNFESCPVQPSSASSDEQTTCNLSSRTAATVRGAVSNPTDENLPHVLCSTMLDCDTQTCSPVDSMSETPVLEVPPAKIDFVETVNTPSDNHHLVAVNPCVRVHSASVELVEVADEPSKAVRLVMTSIPPVYTEYKSSLKFLIVPSVAEPLPDSCSIPPFECDLFNLPFRSLNDECFPLHDESATIINAQQVSVDTVESPNWKCKEVEVESFSTEEVCVMFRRLLEPEPPDHYLVHLLPIESSRSLDLNTVTYNDDAFPCPTNTYEYHFPFPKVNKTPWSVLSSAPVFSDPLHKLSRVPLNVRLKEQVLSVPCSKHPLVLNNPKEPDDAETPFLPRRPGVPITPFRPIKQMPKKSRVPKAPFSPEKSGVSETPTTSRGVPPNLNIPKVNIRKMMPNVPIPGVLGTPTTLKKSHKPMMYTLPEARCPQPAGEYVRANAKFSQ